MAKPEKASTEMAFASGRQLAGKAPREEGAARRLFCRSYPRHRITWELKVRRPKKPASGMVGTFFVDQMEYEPALVRVADQPRVSAVKIAGAMTSSYPLTFHDCDAYCKIVVSVQLGEVKSGVPLELNRITPDASEQNARCPVVPVVIGVAVTT
jgi:hypothetical protein